MGVSVDASRCCLKVQIPNVGGKRKGQIRKQFKVEFNLQIYTKLFEFLKFLIAKFKWKVSW